MTEYKRLTNRKEITEHCLSIICDDDCENCYWGKVSQRLAELEDQIENGTLVQLPCKMGDVVYKVITDKRIKQPYEYIVTGYWISVLEGCNDVHLVRCINGVFDHSISVPFKDFGKTVFLTKAEAEAKLAELKEEQQ